MKLDEAQKEAVAVYTGNCAVIAAAGSGKTKVLVARMVNLITEHGVKPENILAITFNKKSRDNIMTRFKALLPDAKVQIETFHSLGYKIIRHFGNNFDMLTYNWQKKKIFDDLFRCEGWNRDDINSCFLYISVRKNNLLKPGEKSHQYPLDPMYDAIYNRYEQYKKSINLLDYDDLLTNAYEILAKDSNALAVCRNKFKYILVDEMQDTNKAQYELLKLINAHGNLFVVGDILQNIYNFRGSDNKFMLNFKNDFPGAKIINMNTNYRSSKDIVNFANFFASHLPESKAPEYKPSISFKPENKPVIYNEYKDEDEEANGIAAQIAKDIKSKAYDYKDFAILSRTNAQLQNFETVFHNNNIPYQIVGGISFVNRKEIKIVLDYLRLAENKDDDVAFKYIYNKPNRWLSKIFLNNISNYAKQNKMSLYSAMDHFKDSKWHKGIISFQKSINIMCSNNFINVEEQIKVLRRILQLDDFIMRDVYSDENDNDRIESLNNLEFMSRDYTKRADFVKYINGISISSMNGNTVKLSTIHKAKGLEWPVVFFIDVNDGILPHKRSESLFEEARLVYVAITRAMDELYCSSTQSLCGKSASKSQFIKIMFKI